MKTNGYEGGGRTKKIVVMYFSATGTTKKVVASLAGIIAEETNSQAIITIDFTLPAVRKEPVFLTKDDLLIIGVPVYAGRVPNVLLKYLNSISGNGALAVAVVVYGNRNYDDALLELKDILKSRGFIIIAAGAFIGEHSFSRILAVNRPDYKDMVVVRSFAEQISKKITVTSKLQPVTIIGERPYRDYYRPKDVVGNSVDIRKVNPKTNSGCNNCKLCVSACPMGSIDPDKVSLLNGICIKCCACIKKCPMDAKYFDDISYLWYKQELELKYAERREPELFLG